MKLILCVYAEVLVLFRSPAAARYGGKRETAHYLYASSCVNSYFAFDQKHRYTHSFLSKSNIFTVTFLTISLSAVILCMPFIYVRAGSCCCSLNFCMCIPVSVRDLGMVPYIKIFLDEDQHRGPTLSILEQLAEINPEEFMSTAIGALCSSTQQELGLKRDLLQVLAYYMHP